MRRVEIAVASPRSSASSTMALSANRAPERSSRSSCPLSLQILDPPERRDHLLADRCALAPALDDLQIGAAARSLLAEIHGGKPAADSMSVRTKSAAIPRKSSEIGTKRGTTFSRPRTLALKLYQWLTRHTHAPTVEDQPTRMPSDQFAVACLIIIELPETSGASGSFTPARLPRHRRHLQIDSIGHRVEPDGRGRRSGSAEAQAGQRKPH